jgi:hypothetical protein
MTDLALIEAQYPRGTRLTVDHDGFKGRVVGYYMTLEGKPGLALQLKNSRVVHVYSTRWFGEKS